MSSITLDLLCEGVLESLSQPALFVGVEPGSQKRKRNTRTIAGPRRIRRQMITQSSSASTVLWGLQERARSASHCRSVTDGQPGD